MPPSPYDQRYLHSQHQHRRHSRAIQPSAGDVKGRGQPQTDNRLQEGASMGLGIPGIPEVCVRVSRGAKRYARSAYLTQRHQT